MNIHLHHAISQLTYAINELSGVSFFKLECGATGLSESSLASARAKLELATEEMDAYAAELAAKAGKVAA